LPRDLRSLEKSAKPVKQAGIWWGRHSCLPGWHRADRNVCPTRSPEPDVTTTRIVPREETIPLALPASLAGTKSPGTERMVQRCKAGGRRGAGGDEHERAADVAVGVLGADPWPVGEPRLCLGKVTACPPHADCPPDPRAAAGRPSAARASPCRRHHQAVRSADTHGR